LDEALQVIVTNYNLDKVKKSFNGWNETLVMRFPDIERNFMYIISGSEGIEFKEGDDPDAAVQVEMDSILFQKLIAKQVNAIKAYSSGKMNVSGQMKNMLKLRKLMF
jgi:putative sterol carrier protein